MNKKLLVGIIAAVVVLVGAGAWAYTASMQEDTAEDAMVNTTNTDTMAKEDSANDTDTMMDDKTTASHGSYLPLTDYNSNKEKYDDSTVVYFFHASWCHICQGIEEEITSNNSADIPKNVTLVKTDFDSETSLRQKYGVTTQYTFVQVDKDGNLVKKWNATSLDAVVAGIQS